MNASMRDAFLDEIYDIARQDQRVMLISNDFGAPALDKFRVDCQRQFIHIGIAEQNMVNVAAGLALGGKVVYMYSIAPFLPLRCYEQLRVHLGFKRFHVIGVVVGAGYSYDLSGPSHHTLEDIALMNALPGMTVLSASDSSMGAAFARMTYTNPGSYYVRFDRERFEPLYNVQTDFSAGLGGVREGKDLTIVATGIMTHHALKVADALAGCGVKAGVVDLYRIKPLNAALLMEVISKTKRVVSIEENFLQGGIGAIIATTITDAGQDIRLKRFGVPDRYLASGGGRHELHRLAGLDVDTITQKTLEWLATDPSGPFRAGPRHRWLGK